MGVSMYKKLLAIFSIFWSLNGSEIKPDLEYQIFYKYTIYETKAKKNSAFKRVLGKITEDRKSIGDSKAMVQNNILFIANKMGHIYVFDLASKQIICEKNLGFSIIDFDVSALAGQIIFVVDQKGWIYSINFFSGEILNVYKKLASKSIKKIIYLPIYNYLAVATEKSLEILNAETFDLIYTVAFKSNFYSMHMNPFDNQLLISLLNGDLIEIDTKYKSENSSPAGQINAVHFISKNKYFIGFKSSVLGFKYGSVVPEYKMIYQGMEIDHISRINSLIAIASNSGLIKIINSEKSVVFGPNDPITIFQPGIKMTLTPPKFEDLNNLVFSPTGKFLASGTKHGILRIFDVESGHKVLFSNFGYSISLIHFLSDNELLVVTTEGKILFLKY